MIQCGILIGPFLIGWNLLILREMNCGTNVIQMGAVGVFSTQMKSSICIWLNFQKNGTTAISITMRDRSKNRKPLQKGRYLSIEAIQTVQALKRAANQSEVSLEQAYNNKFRRLLKFDMKAVLRELLRQNQCFLALKVFLDVRKEDWYRPDMFLYAEMITVLGSNGFLDKVELILKELQADRDSMVDPDVEGFNALLESLMNLNLTRLAMECFQMMKSLSWEPDRASFEIMMNGLESNKEMDLLAVVREDALKQYKHYFVDFEDN